MDLKKKTLIFSLITVSYALVQFQVSYLSNSLTLFSDSVHMMIDCAGMCIASFVMIVRPLYSNDPIGLRMLETRMGITSAFLLMTTSFMIFQEACERLYNPIEVTKKNLLITSMGGFLVNLLGVVAFFEQRFKDITMHNMYMHIYADMIESFGVVLSMIFVERYNMIFLDTIVSFVIGSMIFVCSVKMLLGSVMGTFLSYNH